MKSFLQIFFFSFLFSSLIYSQTRQLRFEHLTIEDGLPENSGVAIYQDHLGFIWIGTYAGLVKYDGYQLVHYRSNQEDAVKDGVLAIEEDYEGMLWLGTMSGLKKFNPVTNDFLSYDFPDSINRTYKYLPFLHFSNDKKLWFINSGNFNLYRFDIKTHELRNFGPSGSNVNKINSPVTNWNYLKLGKVSFLEDRKGNIFIGTESTGLYKYIPDKDTLINFRNDLNNMTSLGSNKVFKIFQDSHDNIWLGTDGGGLNLYNPETGTFKRYEHINGQVNSLVYNVVLSIYEDRKGFLWLSTPVGLDRFNPEKNEFIHFTHDANDNESISTNLATPIYEDEDGNIWLVNDNAIPEYFDYGNSTFLKCSVDPQNSDNYRTSGGLNTFLADHSGILWFGTWLGGINIYNPSKSFFKNWELSLNGKEVGGKDVSSICEDTKNNLAVITGEGTVYMYDKSRIKREEYNFLGKELREQAYFNFPRAIFDENDDLWIGDIGPRLFKLDTGTKSFTEYTIKTPIKNIVSIQNRVQWIFEEDDDKLLIGILDGVIELNKRTGSSSFFQMGFKDLNAYRILGGAFKDKQNRIWFSTNYKGIYEFLPKKKEFIKPVNSYIQAMKLYEDNKGNLWLGTFVNGLVLMDKEKGVLKSYTLNDGLPNNQIRNMVEDDEGNLWILTPNGVSRFNPEKELFKNFGTEDGLKNKRYDAIYKSSNGEIFFGSSNGLVSFFPNQAKDNIIPPKVVITNISLFNRSDDSLKFDKSISDLNEIELSYDKNDLYFEFVALHYVKPEKNLYSVMLDNFDDNWTKPGTMRSAAYTNLSPGEYKFKVKAANSDGVWNEEGASIKIIILPPWWATTWSYIFYLLIICSSIYFIWRMQLRRIKVKHEFEMSKFEAQKLHEVDELKSRFFTNISHEFRTPLTLILAPLNQMINKLNDGKMKDDLSMVHRNANKLLELVNQLLDISKLESGNMKLQTTPQNIIQFLKAIVLSFTSYAERKKIALKFKSNMDEMIVYLDKDKLEKIITNILSNAFKFTPEGGQIEVNVIRDDNIVIVSVMDTGIGIQKEKLPRIFDRFYQVDSNHTREQKGTGIGLSLTKELVELHKGKISVESEEGKGTTVKISLPLGKDHLEPNEIVEVEKEKQEVVVLKKEIISELEERTDVDMVIETGLFVDKAEKPLLLIVEDNADVRNYIKDNLKNEFRVIEAVDGEDGWNKSTESIPDLIVSDVMMPGIDGFKLCTKLKAEERTSHIPVILLTAKAAKQDKIEGYETGADEYIMKPFDADELRARIKNLVAQRKRIQEYFKKQGFSTAEYQKITSVDKRFLQKCLDVINKHISDSNFSVELLAEDLSISRSVLQRKMHSLVGESPAAVIRRIRLVRAAELIKNRFGNLSEIALEVGYNNPAHFAEAFKRQFGTTPSQFQQNNSKS